MENFSVKKLIAFAAVLLPLLGIAQNTKTVLEKFMAQMKNLKTVAIDFEYRYENAAEKADNRQQGQLLIMDKMYKLDWETSAIYCNGQLRWTYLKDVNEVTINTPSMVEDGIFADPSMLFSFDEKDYQHKLRSERANVEGKVVLEVDLFPKDKKTGYTSIRLQVEKATQLPVSIVYYGKNGSNVTVKIQKIDAAIKPTPADFTFDVKKRPDVEVVDMR
ncbi:MAG: outer membrane lipoprotein carrier protein LolA [Prevotellaceae bacterium]|jgi:outer membrane lipoprotein-sorting protein|nr:outer membrane lipoprotein carrier protein LolA [Prevotellaceae bacterium]